MKLFDRLKVDGDDDEADKGGTITVGIFWNVTIARRKEGIGRRIRFLDGGLTEEKKVRLSGIRRSDERKQEEDMDAAIEVDLKLRDRRRWMNVYTKSNHNPQLSNKAMNLGNFESHFFVTPLHSLTCPLLFLSRSVPVT